MCHNKGTEFKMNILHEKALKMVFWDYEPIFEQLLDKDLSKKNHLKTVYLKALRTHHQNIYKLLIEMYRAFSSLSKVVLVSYLIEGMSTISVYDIVTISKAVAES